MMAPTRNPGAHASPPMAHLVHTLLAPGQAPSILLSYEASARGGMLLWEGGTAAGHMELELALDQIALCGLIGKVLPVVKCSDMPVVLWPG